MKTFTPKMGSARPRATATLTSATLQQFEDQKIPDQKPPKRDKVKGKKTVSMALQGAF